jgi:hypothetical protein
MVHFQVLKDIIQKDHYIDKNKWSPLIYNSHHFFALGNEMGKSFVLKPNGFIIVKKTEGLNKSKKGVLLDEEANNFLDFGDFIIYFRNWCLC